MLLGVVDRNEVTSDRNCVFALLFNSLMLLSVVSPLVHTSLNCGFICAQPGNCSWGLSAELAFWRWERHRKCSGSFVYELLSDQETTTIWGEISHMQKLGGAEGRIIRISLALLPLRFCFIVVLLKLTWNKSTLTFPFSATEPVIL